MKIFNRKKKEVNKFEQNLVDNIIKTNESEWVLSGHNQGISRNDGLTIIFVYRGGNLKMIPCHYLEYSYLSRNRKERYDFELDNSKIIHEKLYSIFNRLIIDNEKEKEENKIKEITEIFLN